MLKQNMLRFRQWLTSKQWSTVTLSLLVTVYFTVAFNQPFIEAVISGHGINKPIDYLFMVTAIIFLMVLINFVISLFAFRYLFKYWLIILCLGSAFTSYFMQTYHIYVDSLMIQNVIETDFHEAKGLFSWKLVFEITVFGLIPCFIIIKLPIQYGALWKELLKKIIIVAISLLTIILIALSFYQDYASLLRNNRHLRELIIPVGYVNASYAYANEKLAADHGTTRTLGEDAHLGSRWGNNDKKVVSIIVVGETARAESFSLGGYARETNPELKKQDIVYYNNFHSCGTATATSVPCMFSNLGRKNFSHSVAKHTENLLDVIHHAGLPVLWRDNNSGCKDVCTRVDYEDVGHIKNDNLCNSRECFDMVLLDNLQNKIRDYFNSTNNTPASKGMVIVLHMKGSHGPDYYNRTPNDFQPFQPQCLTNRMIECKREDIINAYDNTIFYTDFVLSNIVDFLKQHTNEYDSSLFFVSDHGESLGENNLYLHGMPYSIAPEQQTHVPALFWLSDEFAKRFGIDKQCLIQHASDNYSQDNLFHSTLGLLDISTRVYNPDLDMFKNCKSQKIN